MISSPLHHRYKQIIPHQSETEKVFTDFKISSGIFLSHFNIWDEVDFKIKDALNKSTSHLKWSFEFIKAEKKFFKPSWIFILRESLKDNISVDYKIKQKGQSHIWQ